MSRKEAEVAVQAQVRIEEECRPICREVACHHRTCSKEEECLLIWAEEVQDQEDLVVQEVHHKIVLLKEVLEVLVVHLQIVHLMLLKVNLPTKANQAQAICLETTTH